MVLRPLLPPPPYAQPISAWGAVEATQKNAGADCWLIAQPDHAALAGDIAARLSRDLFPGLDEPVIRGIGLHDEGWGRLDAEALRSSTPPNSFIEESPPTFLEAWMASIERCQQVAPIAGVIVSQHFCRLADFRLRARKDPADDTRLLLGFLMAEDQRRRALLPSCSHYNADFLTDVLQFCDVLSLYLCCGALDSVTFPQHCGGGAVRLQRVQTSDEAAICRFSPSILETSAELAVSARRWPATGDGRQFLFVLE